LRRIGELETAIAPSTAPTTAWRYVTFGDWIVKPELLLKRLLSRRRHIVSIMTGKVAYRGCLRYLENGTSLRAPSRADLVNIRAHFKRTGLVRSFYISGRQPTSMKAWLPPRTGRSNREVEVRNRLRVAEIGHLCVPAILSHGVVGDMEYMLEEFVDAHLPSRDIDRERVAGGLLPALRAHYQSHGISTIAVADYLGPDFCNQLDSASQALPWPSDWLARRTFLGRIRQLYDSGMALPCSFGHGDLNVSHVGMKRDGRFMILDWEAAGDMPVAADLADLDRTCGNRERWFHQACATTVDELKSGRDVLRATDQLMLLALRRAGRFGHLVDLRRREGRTALVAAKLTNYFGYAQRLMGGVCAR
jgi:hypothetical protein